MSRLVELSEAARTFKEAMIKLNSIKSNLDLLDKEIYLLSNEKEKLEENIDCLKKQGVIAIANEYKKIKQELLLINNKLFLLTRDRNNQTKIYIEAENYVHKTKSGLEKAQKGIDNNVISVNFRK